MTNELKKEMPFDEYLAVEACHKSALHHVKTGKHLRAFEKKSTDTDALRFGRMFHTALLEPDLGEEYEVFANQEWIKKQDHIDKISINEQKAAWKEEREHYFANDQEKENLEEMVKAIKEHPIASKYLSGEGDAEACLFWTDEKTGLPCKTRLDWLRSDDVLVEVKTDVDPSPEAFGKKIYNMGYHIGAWFNREGFRAVMGRDIKAFVFIAVEKSAPYAVGVYMMNAHDFDSGEINAPPLMKRYQLIKKGGLNDYNQGEDGEYNVLHVQTPGWELRIVEDEMCEIEAPEEGSEL